MVEKNQRFRPAFKRGYIQEGIELLIQFREEMFTQVQIINGYPAEAFYQMPL